MQKLSKFIVFFVLCTLYFVLHPMDASAQVPGLRFPCEDVDSPEFHSLRPYQAAHCGDAGKARYCSNDLKFVETFDDFPQCVADAPDVDGAIFDCSLNPPFQVPIHDLIVTLDDSMFPIMGNTEEVKNSDPNSSEIFDDATKVNEYASWYLSGVNNRAEYGENTDDRVVNFSGPVQKLLPKMIQEAERINTINKAAINGEPWTDPDDGITYTTPQNHNQVVVCGDSNLGWFGGLLNIGKITPVPCYEGDEKFRLKDEGVLGDEGWYGGDLSAFNGLFNRIGTDIWNKRTPPLPWDDGTGKPFETQIKYQKAYSEWRGASCATIPFIDMNLCIDNPFVPNKWAELYQYIPLSNTTDKKGNEYLNPEHPIYRPAAGTEIKLGNPPNDTPKNAPLYFAHTQEVKESSELLNKTFTPLDCPVDEEGNRITDEECKLLKNKRGSVEKNYCSVANIRVNKGDNLFPGEIQVPKVNYSITQVRCKVKYKEVPCRGHLAAIGQCPNPPFIKKTVTCHAEVAITLKTWTKTPNADEIFDSTVAGTGSTFRKIFPKVEEGAPVSCIADMPTVTDVTYTGTNTLQDGDSVFSVARFPEDGAGDNPQLTFPHVGSVYEYFLKGIQTALRPKGYGEPIASGTLCKSVEETKCKEDVPDSAVDSKYLGSFKTNFIDLADRWTTDCPGPENNLAEECYNYVASESKKAGVNPAFALTIWLNESGASNYCHGGDTTQDFGYNVAALYQDMVGQLKGFLGMAKQKLCDGISGFVEPMHGWLSRYQSSSGSCDPSDTVATDYYYAVKDETWSYLTSCASAGKFGITWPTDMSCP